MVPRSMVQTFPLVFLGLAAHLPPDLAGVFMEDGWFLKNTSTY